MERFLRFALQILAKFWCSRLCLFNVVDESRNLQYVSCWKVRVNYYVIKASLSPYLYFVYILDAYITLRLV